MADQPVWNRSFAAFLFDMDGTIIDSIAVANRVWTRWAHSHGLDAAQIIKVMHGVQVVQTVRRFAPAGMDIEREAEAITTAEIDDVEGIREIAGARRFLDLIPRDRWAVVTSAPRALAIRRLAAAGLPMPAVLVTADDVTDGKPSPSCFIAAAKSLGVPVTECLIWEDAPAGIAAAEASGAAVIVVAATHHQPLETAHEKVIDYEGLRMEVDGDGKLKLIRQAGQARAI